MNVAAESNFEESPFMLKINNNSNNNNQNNEEETIKDESVTPECDEPTIKMTETSSKKDVLTRLDSLVTGNGVTCDERDDTAQSVSDIFAKISRDKRKNDKTANPTGILKKPDTETGEPEKKVKRRIRFPDHEEMHEVIGYGGDVDYSSDEDEDERSFASRRSRFADFGDKDDEMTVEEKNVLNLTRKNTTFNSHAPNLSVEGPPGPVQPQVRLGCNDSKKGPAPLITVRPFVREHTPGKVNMVSPMRNGEVVTSFSVESPTTTTPTTAERDEEENAEALLTTTINNKSEGEGGGVVAINNKKKTSASVILSREADKNSSEESGLNSDHTDASSSSEEGEMNLMNGGSSSPLFSDTLSDGNESTSLDGDLRSSLQQQKQQQQDDEDLLLSGNNFERETTASLSSVSDDGEASNEGSSTSTSGDEDIKCEKDKSVDEEEVHHQHGRDYFHATARLSFLHSTIQFEEQSCNKEEQQQNNSIRQQNNSYNSEESSEYSSSNDSSTRPKVKITRKSPYVVGPYASTAILKGTPKPSVNIRKPPLPKEKPKVPLKPEKFLHNSNSKVSPIAAPRKSSFRSSSQPPPMPSSSEYANVANEVRISDESRIQLCLSSLPHDQNLPHEALPAYECYSANSDVQNALIIDVSASGPVVQNDSNVVTISSSSFHTDTVSTTTTTALSQNQKDSATKNREALEAIRKSLSDKLAEVVIVDAKQVESKKEEKDESEEKENGQNVSVSAAPVKRSVEKTVSNTSSNFELNRATIANALEFNRHDRVARPSTKRQAPKPPPNSLTESGTDSLSSAEPEQKSEPQVVDVAEIDEAPTKELPPEPIPIPPPPPPPPAPSMPKSALSTTSAGRHSSMKSSDASSPKSREVKNRVQFSPETMTVTLPPTDERNLQPISYNRWMGRAPGDVIESSFTGQPINVPRPPHVPVVVASGSAPLSHPKRPVPVTYAPMPQVDDEVRRWTEKKHKQRSKSLPRGSEIDEIIGSSKLTKAGSKLFSPSVLSSSSVTSSNPVRRQSRVELYETERKQLQQQLQQQQRKGKFSLKKFFKIGLNHNPYGIQFPPGEGSKSPTPTQPSSAASSPAHQFLDKEHEREILERERSRLRPEIIHPIDLQSAGVEVVCITPRGGPQQHFEKNQRTSNGVNKAGACKTLTSNKGKVDYVDSKDSGHETSSIHTENSEGSASSTTSSAAGSSVQTPSPTLQKSFLQKEEPEDHGELPADRLRNKGNGGRSKPVPPPRSHSLETFGKKFDLEDRDDDQDEDDDDQAETDLELTRVNIVAETEVGKNQGYDKFGPQTSSSLAPCVRGLERFDTDKPLTSLSSESSSSADGLPPHQAYIQPGKMKIGNMTSVPAINTIQHSSFGSPQHSSPIKFGGATSRTGSLHSSSGGHSDSFSFPRGMMVYPVMTEEEVVTGYYGSEGDSERESISPPRINHRDEAADEDEPVRSGPNSKSGGREGSRGQGLSRLSIRKGRSVVHKNLEDNYGAVISANHEALAQILEQASQRRPCVGKTMRPLSNLTDLKLDQFTQAGSLPTTGHESTRVETKAGTFVSAFYTSTKTPVTLMLNTDRSFTKKNQNSFSLFPAASFEDVANLNTIFGAKFNVDLESNKKVFVSVFPRMQVETLSSYSAHLATSTKLNSTSWEKEVSFILLQLINALKFLQAQGIEEITPDLNHFVLSREDRDPHYRVVIVENVTGDENDGVTRMSLSCTALAAMLLLFHCDDPVGQAQCWVTSSESDASASRPTLPELTPSVGMFRTMADLLQKGSSIALNQVKSMLEYMLWGPSDITMSQSREQGLQRWLDLERATVLNNLIRTQGLWNIELTIFEEYHLLFLVQTCAKMLLEASLLFESEVACM